MRITLFFRRCLALAWRKRRMKIRIHESSATSRQCSTTGYLSFWLLDVLSEPTLLPDPKLTIFGPTVQFSPLLAVGSHLLLSPFKNTYRATSILGDLANPVGIADCVCVCIHFIILILMVILMWVGLRVYHTTPYLSGARLFQPVPVYARRHPHLRASITSSMAVSSKKG